MATQRSQAKRSVTAKELLDETRERLNELQTFLENDQSAVLAGLDQVQGETDPRTFFLLTKKRNASHRPTISDLFKRLLAIRYLASGYEMWLQDRGEVLMLRDSYEKPRNHGLCKIFMREHGLPNTSQVRGWIDNGQKVLRIERDVGVPGASLSLVLALPKFPHFYNPEISKLARLVNTGFFPDIRELAVCVSGDYLNYIRLYEGKQVQSL